ncbi:FtsW/RodA/SpoVE family cell cycle protein [Patescibacteria group bacterium]|nr:FtsW/RodA/SpoVE family cell cycle protein [Patescibacteria group bacterium]
MQRTTSILGPDLLLFVGIAILSILGVVVLMAISPQIFPQYFLYVILGFIAYIVFAQIDFDVLSLFSRHFYIGSLIFLILPIIIGQVTRGTIRWFTLGPLNIQPAEIVRPFLLVFFANYLAGRELRLKKVFRAIALFFIPFILIALQPSLGVAVLTAFGFLGILIASPLEKKYFVYGGAALIALIPLIWLILAPYQRNRITSFASGYNSLQSMISVGSGKFFGRGLGKGTETQLLFLPEKQTDFIFAATAEELGFVGAILLVLGEFFILWRITKFMENAINPQARAFLSGLFSVLLFQVFVHIGMNLGILPITGVPLPLVSAGGSSLLATMISLGIAAKSARKISP